MRCKNCAEEKPWTEEFFVKQGTGKLWNQCKVCQRKYMRAHYRIKNPKKSFVPRPEMPLKKQCNRCWIEKPFTDEFFHRNKNAIYGLNYICKICNCKNVLRLKYKTNVVKDGKRCEICGCIHKLVYDHNHRTGEARGIICQGCNSWLSAVENPTKRNGFVRYLLKHNSWVE